MGNDTPVPSLRGIGIDPAIINMGIAAVDVFGYIQDTRLVAAAEAKYGKGSAEVKAIPCDVPHINLVSSEHWDVRNRLGSLATYINPELKAAMEKPADTGRQVEYAFQVLSPNTYMHKFNTTPAHRDTAARMIAEHPLIHEKYLSLSGNMELPAVLAENQQDQIKNGKSDYPLDPHKNLPTASGKPAYTKFDYRAPVYNVCTSMMSGVRSIDVFRGEYGRIIANHSKKWGIDRKSPSSGLNATEYHERKTKSENEMFNLLAANGLDEWIAYMEDIEKQGFKLDDRADAILICVHWLMELYDTFMIRDGIKHKNAVDVRQGFTNVPDVPMKPLGRSATKPRAKKATIAKPTPSRKRPRSKAANTQTPEERNAAIEKHLRERRETRESPLPRPHKRAKVSEKPLVIDMTGDDDGYISDTWVEAGGGLSYEDFMETVGKIQAEKGKAASTPTRRRQSKLSFAGKLKVTSRPSLGTAERKPGQSKIERFFGVREESDK